MQTPQASFSAVTNHRSESMDCLTAPDFKHTSNTEQGVLHSLKSPRVILQLISMPKLVTLLQVLTTTDNSSLGCFVTQSLKMQITLHFCLLPLFQQGHKFFPVRALSRGKEESSFFLHPWGQRPGKCCHFQTDSMGAAFPQGCSFQCLLLPL